MKFLMVIQVYFTTLYYCSAKLSLSEWNQHNHSQHQHEYYKEIQKAKEKAIRHIIVS